MTLGEAISVLRTYQEVAPDNLDPMFYKRLRQAIRIIYKYFKTTDKEIEDYVDTFADRETSYYIGLVKGMKDFRDGKMIK